MVKRNIRRGEYRSGFYDGIRRRANLIGDQPTFYEPVRRNIISRKYLQGMRDGFNERLYEKLGEQI